MSTRCLYLTGSSEGLPVEGVFEWVFEMSGPGLKSHRDSTQLDDRNLNTQLQTSHPSPAYHERSLRGWQLAVRRESEDPMSRLDLTYELQCGKLLYVHCSSYRLRTTHGLFLTSSHPVDSLLKGCVYNLGASGGGDRG